MLEASIGPFGRAGADDRVQLVDEEHDVARPLDLVEHALETLLELAAVLGAGDHAAEVESQHALAAQALGDVGGDDLLGEALGDRRLADAGLADQHRVVLRAAAEHLDDALDLLVTSDDRVEPVVARQRGEVARVRLEHALARRLLLVVDPGRAHLPEGAHESLLGDPRVAQDRAAAALALEQDAQQQVLGADERVAHLLGALDGDVERCLGARRRARAGRRRRRGRRASRPADRRAPSRRPCRCSSVRRAGRRRRRAG